MDLTCAQLYDSETDTELANHFACDRVLDAKLCGKYGDVAQSSLRVEAVDITHTSIKFEREGYNAVAHLPSMLFRQTLATDQLVRAEAAITLIYRADGPLDLEDLFGPVSDEDDLTVQSQSIEGDG